MVKQIVKFEQISSYLNQILGQPLSEPELSQLCAQIQTITLTPRQEIWNSITAEPGLYIVIAGKVRLIDSDRNWLTNLEPGQAFGELTLFPDAQFNHYSVRSTREDTTLYRLSEHALQEFIGRYPDIRELLYRQAAQKCALPQEQSIPLEPFTQPIPQSQLTKPQKFGSIRKKDSQPSQARHANYWPSPTLQVGHLWQRVVRRYPFFAQQSGSDCGAACLVMIARYWGQTLSVNRLRELANVDRNGASLAGLAVAAEKIGFLARPVKGHLQGLSRSQLPAIAHWEGKHFITIYAITPKQVIICDPAIGQISLSHAAFLQKWTGYALLLEPTASLLQTPGDRQSFWQFWDLVKPHRVVLLEVVIASVLIQLFGLLTPLLMQILLDRVVVQRSTLTLTAVGLGLLIFSLFRVMMAGLRQYLLDHTANKIDLALIVGFINHTFRLPLRFFETRYVGDILSRVQENQKIQRFLTGEAITFMLDLLSMFVYIGLMLSYSWKMALLVLAVIPPFAMLALISTPFLQRISREIFKSLAEETGYLIQALTGIRTVKSMAAEQMVRWHWEDLLNQYVRKTFRGQSIGNILQVTSGIIEAVTTTGLLWFGAWLVIQGELTIGQLVAFNMLLGNVLSPFRRLTGLWNQLQEVTIAIERIQDVLDSEPEESFNEATRQNLPTIRGHIRFENVTFRYHSEDDRNVLENLSFEVQPGQMVAVVGRSGSGKSTLAKLLLNLYAPTDGKIFIDGCDVMGVSKRSLRQQIGVVDQDTFLFSGTIRENITVTYPDASLEEVIRIADLAGAHSFIQDLPLGYETQIGEGGGLLSGGQRQRLAIARALMGNPRLLIFDEATSALDTESEQIIQRNLKTILRDRTAFVIAHRLSTIRNAHSILVLDRGVLIEQGTHQQLIAQKGTYYHLNQQQLDDREQGQT